MAKKRGKAKEAPAIVPSTQAPAEQRTRTPVKFFVSDDRIISENSDQARELYNQSRFGSMILEGKIQLSLLEAVFLLEKGKAEIVKGRTSLSFEAFFKLAKRQDQKFWVRYAAFKDLRIRGYIVKTALKFGADFRVYDRGVKPGEDHARWIVYPVHEASSLTWYDFSAKNRVAHSTKKRLMVAAVDDEGDVTYWEIRWLRP